MAEISRRALGKGVLGLSMLGIVNLAAGCTTAGQSSTAAGAASGSAAVKGGTITVASGVDPVPLNSVKGAAALGPQLVFTALYDNLMRYEADGSVVPHLATKVVANENNTKFTVTLRDGVKFTDGETFNAQAFATFLEAVKVGGGPAAGDAKPLTVTVKDALTFEIASEQPNAKVPELLAGTLGAVPSPKQLTAADADVAPVGAGPYVYDKAKSTSGNTYTLTRNPGHWNKDAYPYDTLVVKVLTDPAARINALKTNQVNIAELSATQAKEGEASGLTLLRQAQNWAGVNIADREGKLVPALKDVRVRQAICMAFDREAIVKNALGGEGTAGNQVFPKGMAGHVDSLDTQYAFNIEKAKSLLAEAGFAGGFSLEIPAIDGITQHNPLIITQLKAIGITATEVKVPIQQAFAQVLGGKFPLVPGVGVSTPVSLVNEMISVSAVWNIFHTITPELAALVTTAQSSSGATQKKAFEDIGKYVLDNAYFAVWGHSNAIYGLTSKVSAAMLPSTSLPALRTYKPKG